MTRSERRLLLANLAVVLFVLIVAALMVTL